MFKEEFLQQNFTFLSGYPKILIGFNIILEDDNRISDNRKVLDIKNKESEISIYNVKITTFFTLSYLLSLIKFLQDNPHVSVFLYSKDITIHSFKALFKENGISISGGNNTLKHILSPQQFLLSKIICLFYGSNSDLVNKSFLKISSVKFISRPLYDFTSEKHRLILERIRHENESYIKLGERDKDFQAMYDYFVRDEDQKHLITRYSYTYNINRRMDDKIISPVRIQKRDFHYMPANFDSIGCFSKIKKFLESKPINNKTQEELEVLLYHKSVNSLLSFSEKKSNKDSIDNGREFPSELKVKLLSLMRIWEKHLTDLKRSFENNKSIKNKVDFYEMTDVDKKKLLFLEIINYLKKGENNKTDLSEIPENSDSIHSKSTKLKNEKIIGKMLLCLLTIIKYSDSEEPDSYDIKTSVVASTVSIGKEVVLLYLSELFKEQHEFKSLSLFRANIDQKDEKFKLLLDQKFLSYIGGKLINVLMDSAVLDTTILTKNDKRYNFLKISSKTVLKHKNKTLVTPIKLPMIVEPNKYSKETLGGYLLNDKLFIDCLINKRPTDSQVENINSIYHTINELASTSFKVNKDVLDFILANSKEFFKEKPELNVLDKKGFLNWRDNIKYKSLLSVKILKENIIGIALCYRDIPNIYFPVKLDYHSGKISIIPQYFHLQSHEMAKSLLLRSKPVTIQKTDPKAIEFYKVMAANYFGNGVENSSFYDKLKWFDKNERDIINFENRKLLNKANKKFLLLAFCIEYKDFYKFMVSDKEYYDSYLPVKFDANSNEYRDQYSLAQENSIYKSKKQLSFGDGKDNIKTMELKTSSTKNLTIDLANEKKVKKRNFYSTKWVLTSVLNNWTQKLLDILFTVGVILFSSILYLILKEDLFDMKYFYNNSIYVDNKLNWMWNTDNYWMWDSDDNWMWDSDNNLHWMLDYFNNSLEDPDTRLSAGAEEPVERKIREESNFFRNIFIDLFTQKNKVYHFIDQNKYFNHRIKQDITTDFSYKSGMDTSVDLLVNERPQVYSSILKHHLDIANKKISILSDKLSASEVLRLRKEVTIHDSVSLCRKALTGVPYSGDNSPVVEYINPLRYSTPILRSNSPINEYSSIQSSTTSQTAERISLTAETVTLSNLEKISTGSALKISQGYSVSADTDFMENYNSALENNNFIPDYSPSSVHSSNLNTDKGLLVDTLINQNKNTMLNKSSMIAQSKDYFSARKYPIRTIENTSVLKRYGNFWPNTFNVESPSTIQRYGWVSPAGTSVLEDYSPLAKRCGHIFSEGFTLKKDYHVITEHNNSYKAYSPHRGEKIDWDKYTKAKDAETLNNANNLSTLKDIMNRQEKSFENWKVKEELAQKQDMAEMGEILSKVSSKSSSSGSDITIKGNNGQSSRSS